MGFIRKKRMGAQDPGLDLAAVDSRRAALDAVRRGQLEVLYLLPLEFGGSNSPENVVYVPVGAGEAKRSVDFGVVKALLADGKVERYSAVPRYAGRSFVPVAISVSATGQESFTTTLAVWGESQD